MNLRLQLAMLSIALPFCTHALSPSEALQRMKVADGFTVKLVANEPEVRQPISMSFDDRGRLWVIQYLQYPTPAGLKATKVDQYLRTTYDKIPEPPPRGPKGADKITICEDTNGDGRMDTFKNFVTDLNLCSGMVLGHGGVFVAQPPYLLFYADKNRDDVPDGDPEVLLTGFGMEDAHAYANSLTWGPDGWLYGAQGSTVTATIRGIQFQQGIWRYHPRTRAFELFVEGGGNTWGIDFDENGEVFASTNYEESKLLHQVQGAYYVKNFGKHGALQNPHAYGYFGHVPWSGHRGKHISIGGIIYQGGAFPAEFNGTFIFGNTLDHAVYWGKLQPNGSSFSATHGGTLLSTDDELFRPVDCTVGPDGAVYVADWCDKRASHVDPLDTWDRSNGRIYKIEKAGAEGTRLASSLPAKKFDLTKLSNRKLSDLLTHTNDWFSRQAFRLLGERQAADSSLVRKVRNLNDPNAIKYLWALYVGGKFDEKLAKELLLHPNPHIRKWTIRFLTDSAQPLRGSLAEQLAQAAQREKSAVVRAQLASSAKRLPGNQALPIIRELIKHDEDANDPFVPLLMWWAIEANARSGSAVTKVLLRSADDWRAPIMKKVLLERMAKRFAAGTNHVSLPEFEACGDLLTKAPGEDDRRIVFKGMEQSLTGRRLPVIPDNLSAWFDAAWKTNRTNLDLVRLGLRMGRPEAGIVAVNRIREGNLPEGELVSLLETFSQTTGTNSLPIVLSVFTNTKSENLKLATLSMLERISDPEIGRRVLDLFASLNGPVQARAKNLLTSRAMWAEQLLDLVEAGRIDSKTLSLDQVRQMASQKSESINRRIGKIWGKIEADSPAEKQNRINELKLVLKPSGVVGREVKGDLVNGAKIYQQACGVCHKLFGEGNVIGPELTGTDRKNTELLLQNIVNPSGYVRGEFVSHEIETKDGQVISGLMIESTPGTVTLLDRNNQRHTIARDRIGELKESQTSLMPEGLLDTLNPQQIIDLFSYLQKE